MFWPSSQPRHIRVLVFCICLHEHISWSKSNPINHRYWRHGFHTLDTKRQSKLKPRSYLGKIRSWNKATFMTVQMKWSLVMKNSFLWYIIGQWIRFVVQRFRSRILIWSRFFDIILLFSIAKFSKIPSCYCQKTLPKIAVEGQLNCTQNENWTKGGIIVTKKTAGNAYGKLVSCFYLSDS